MNPTLLETVLVNNKRGETQHLRIYQNWRRNPLGVPLAGLKAVYDEAGRHVNTTDGNTFQVAITGEVLTRV